MQEWDEETTEYPPEDYGYDEQQPEYQEQDYGAPEEGDDEQEEQYGQEYGGGFEDCQEEQEAPPEVNESMVKTVIMAMRQLAEEGKRPNY